MKLNIRSAAAMAVLAATLSTAYAESSSVQHYSRAELKQMEHEAHTVQQYQALAAYFRSRQAVYEAQAQAEKKEWERRSLNVTGPAQKYPRPVDSSKNRYEYFSSEASEMNRQAAHYESLAASAR